MTARVDNCCGDPAFCGKRREILGRVLAESRRSRFYGASRGRTELVLPTIAAAPVAPRKVGWIERLISGPQGDPSLREDFLSFLGCLACGIGLALVFLAIILAGRVLLGGQS